MATRGNGIPKFETVRYETKGAICHITLNRPEKLNAATDQLVEEVNDALFEFDADPDLQVAILSGAGRAFCSGADVQQRQLRTPEEMRRLGGPAGRRSRENGLGDTVNWKPVIAAVRARNRAGQTLVRHRDAAPVSSVHAGPGASPHRGLPRVGSRLRREAQTHIQGAVTAMAYEFATYEKQGRIAVVTINRPKRMNSLHPPANFELHEIWNDFERDPDLWVGIVTGAGDKAFSAG